MHGSVVCCVLSSTFSLLLVENTEIKLPTDLDLCRILPKV